jgi:predicted pyridoxine 5'-phosphate oxidase superfamily flavin-nucleotide-binding protein
LAVQARAGVLEAARPLARGIRPTVPPAAADFLSRQPFAVVGGGDRGGGVWASLLSGAPGFLRALDARAVRIDAAPGPDDPLADGLRPGEPAGLLAIELRSRRRMRLNGTVEVRHGRGITVRARQVYSNCPKYIQRRVWEAAEPRADPAPGRLPVAGRGRRSATLSPAQRRWIGAADTFFFASRHPEAGADASHRGGLPGFVRVADERTLVFPDYPGNNMFNTLGNLAVDPRSGLLFVDFERGATLQVTGRAEVIWDPARAAPFPGAERLVEFRVEAVAEVDDATELRARLTDYSPFNPPPPDHGAPPEAV